MFITLMIIIMLAVGYVLTKPTASNCFDFEQTTGTITKYKEDCGGTKVKIPNKIAGTTVKKIDNYVFMEKNMESVKLPKTLEEIGTGAFESNQLTKISIPNTVTTIGDKAFRTNRLESVAIPNNIKTLGYQSFNDNQLSKTAGFIYKHQNGTVDKNIIVGYGGTERDHVEIPEGTKIIDRDAFANNDIKEITIPNSVESIGHGAFKSNQLTEITIPESVTTIEENVFLDNPIDTIIVKGKTDATQFKKVGKDWGTTTHIYYEK